MTALEAIEAIKDNKPKSGYYILCEALDVAIEALEKQIPKKPKMRHLKSFDGYNDGWCPCCNSYVQEFDQDCCGKCGQKLDWGEQNEKD